MSAVLAFIPKQVLAGLVIALAIATGLQTCTVRKQAGEVAKAQVAVAQAKTVNEANRDTIDQLTAISDAAVEGRRANEVAHKTAVDKWVVERELLQALSNEIETVTIEVYRDPKCADLAKMDITNICPAFVSGMRQRADRINEGRNTGSTGTGSDALRP